MLHLILFYIQHLKTLKRWRFFSFHNKVRVSDPIVPFRESVVTPPKVDQVNEEISQVNKSLFAHHTQRLPAFMLKEIQSFSELITKRDETLTDDHQVRIFKG